MARRVINTSRWSVPVDRQRYEGVAKCDTGRSDGWMNPFDKVYYGYRINVPPLYPAVSFDFLLGGQTLDKASSFSATLSQPSAS